MDVAIPDRPVSLCDDCRAALRVLNKPKPAETKPTTRAGAILREAAAIVDGPRNQTHGDKERSFRAIARLWDAYLAARPGGREQIVSAADTAAMMVLMKFARSLHGQHIADHAIDAAGYAAIWGGLREAETR
jgi:hypothetical protein